jgi:APA family basic amino acid/polyamine antiporter
MRLKKDLKLIDVFAITSGAMISSGIFILPGIAFAKTGPSVFISYILAGILALVGAFSIVELASAMPRAGGDYFFITRSLGPLFGTIAGFLSWFALSLKTAFAIIGIAEILLLGFGIPLLISSVILTILFLSINIIGVSAAGKLEIIIVMLLLALMVFYLITGFPSMNMQRFKDFTPQGINSVFLTAGFVFVAFGGLMQVASISEEVQNPKRNIPLGLFSSVIVVTLLYSLINIVVVGTLDASILSGNLTPVATSAERFLGPLGAFLLTGAALLAFISTGNAGIMSASRYPFALSRDQLIPSFIDRVNPRTGTPVISIVITGVIIILSFLLDLEMLVKVASTVVIVSYILAQIAIIVLRESRIQNYRPSYKSPLYPWIQIISTILFSALLIDIGWEALLISGGLILFAVIIYLLYGRIHNKGSYALLHLLHRITDKELLADHTLESELKEILSERDEIVYDRFDEIVENAHILDLDGDMDSNAFFQLCAQELEPHLDLDVDNLYKLLLQREEISPTTLNSQVAVPHIVIGGKEKFELLIVRARQGIRFSSIYPHIKAIFIILGTIDERQFHLQTLSAIAQISLQPGFIEMWEAAQNENQLRDIIHLSERQRIYQPGS